MGIHITRLRVEQLRRFRQPRELSGFERGLNILAAPNEAGKSTLVRAIRAAFFERHRSTAVDDLRPWGEGSATPHIELDFTLGGDEHRLLKTFLGKKRCTLQIGARTLDGADAEDHLARIFGFAFAGKGASKPEHWGIPGLLWVEQGTGQDLDVSHARNHLHDALKGQADGQAGSLAATGGDELLLQLQGQRGELLTTLGKPRAAYLEAVETAAALQTRLDELDGQIAAYREQVDRLAVLRLQHQADEANAPWEHMRQSLGGARQRQEALQATQAQLQDDQGRVVQLERTRDLLAKELEGLMRQQTNARSRALALAQAQQDLEAKAAAASLALEHADAARSRVHTAAEALRAARQEATRQSLVQQLQQAKADATRCAEGLQRAEEEQERLLDLRASAAAAPTIAKAQVDRLLTLDRAERDARLQRQAVATRLQYRLPSGQLLSLQTHGQAQQLEADGELLIDSPATVQLPGGGQLVITPGGEDLDRLARTHGQAQEALRSLLQSLGVQDVAEAQARLAGVTERDAQIRLGEQTFAIVAPKGLDALRSALSTAQGRISTTQEALGRLPESANPSMLRLDEAEGAHDTAMAAQQLANAALAQAQSQWAGAQSLQDAAQREHNAAQAALADPARQQRESQAQHQLLATGSEQDALAARVALALNSISEARPDILTQDIDRLQRSIEQMTRSHQQRREQILLLENTLQQAGAQGLEEQRETLAGQLAQARRRHTELQHRAEALDLLCTKLHARREATLARLQAPLQQRMQHYLPLLMPGAQVQMDADLAPGLLTRAAQTGGAVETGLFSDLSFGAREQLGLISRFAYADLLQQAGRPTLLILDDALVHSDTARLAQMKRVLFDAATRHQILLFTCHPEDWRDMGVSVRSLD